MKRRYIFFVIILTFNLLGLLHGRFINMIYVFSLSYSLYFINKIEKESKGNNGLTQNEKIQVIITEVLNPIVAGAFYYYIWRSKFPKKANQANLYSWGIVAVELVIAIVLIQRGFLSF